VRSPKQHKLPNIQMEPTRHSSHAIMSSGRAAH
jgi:hypothetical protein